MTKVFFHGKLKQKFGESVSLYIGNIKYLIKSIDCVKSGFHCYLKQITENNFNYRIIFEKKNIVHLVPLITGFGRSFMRVLGIILIVVGFVLTLFGLGQFGIPLMQAGFAIMPPGKNKQKPQQIVVGGSTYSLNSTKKNSTISTIKDNYVQGSIVQIGYGKIMCLGKNIQASVKSLPTNITFETDVYSTDDTSIELYG